MVNQTANRNPVNLFVESVKVAIQGKNAAQDIQKAVALLLKSYGIENPVRK